MKPTISLIAAIGKNRELGRGNELIFKIPEDMKFFREKTRGHAVIMGRKTYESIGHPLPDRTNIIVSQNSKFMIPAKGEALQGRYYSNVKVAHSIEEAFHIGSGIEEKEIFVIGGAQIYSLALPFADRLYLTLVNAKVPDADAFFPDYSEFKTIVSERKSNDDNYVYNFLELTR